LTHENFVLEIESPFLAKFEKVKVGIDPVVSEPLKDGLFFTTYF